MPHAMLKKLYQWRAAQHISVYFIANVLNAALSFLILPVLTRYLAPSEYGTASVFLAIFALAAPCTAMGLTMIVGRNYHKQSPTQHALTTSIAVMLTVLSCVGLFIAVWALGYFVDSLFGIPIAYMLLIPALCLLQNISLLYKTILRHQNRVKLYASLDIGSNTVIRFGGLLAVVYISATWQSLVVVQVAACAMFAAVAVYFLVREKRLTRQWDASHAKQMLCVSWPLMPHAIGGIIMTLSDRLILDRMLDAQAVGVYTIGATVGAAALLFCTAFNNSWGPWMHRQLNHITDEKRIRIVRYTYLYFIVTAILTLAVGAAATAYITLFVDAAYHGAVPVALWVAASTALYGMSFAMTHYLIVFGKTTIFPVVTGICALLNIVLTIWLVSLNGMVGAAQATFASYLVFLLVITWQSQRFFPMPWRRVICSYFIRKTG